MSPHHDLTFWLAVFGAAIFKLLTSPVNTFSRALLTVFAAVFFAYFFTDPVLHWLNLDPVRYTNAMAALLALTGEGIMRMILSVLGDFSKVLEVIRVWRGKE